MSKTSEYIEQYSGMAMEQMKRYGIPASVTLAQGILESSNGGSQLSRECNNHFGIKAYSSWIENGGQYRLYSDDNPNEKFCLYASVADSYEHHSKILANSKRYKACFSLCPDDYKGWTVGLQNGGYATNKQYAASLQKVIEQFGLQKYDKEVMAEMKSQGKKFGTADNPLHTSSQSSDAGQKSGQHSFETKGNTGFALDDGTYSLPIRRSDSFLVTSKYGTRNDPINKGKTQFHQGIDIKAHSDPVLATENNGKVVKVNNATNTGGGKTVVVEYERKDGTKTQCVYIHLSSIAVKVGDAVNAGDRLGVSGNTGTRTTGEHLHFGVRNIDKEGKQFYVNPAAYLAEITAHGNIKTQALYNGKDLLASYTASNGHKNEEINLSAEDWTKKLLASEDAGIGLGLGGIGDNGGLLEMAFTLFSTLIALSTQVEGKTQDEKMQMATDAALNRHIDLSAMTPTLKTSSLHVLENGRMILQTDNGNGKVNHELTPSEQKSLSSILNSNLDDAEKRQRIGSLIGGISLSQQASMNYEKIAEQTQGRELSRGR